MEPQQQTLSLLHTRCVQMILPSDRGGDRSSQLGMTTTKGLCRSTRPALELARGMRVARFQLTPCVPAQHGRTGYDAAVPARSALTGAFPDDIPPEHVSEEAFRWATQLWYSYGMEVGHVSLIKGCMSPSACTWHSAYEVRNERCSMVACAWRRLGLLMGAWSSAWCLWRA